MRAVAFALLFAGWAATAIAQTGRFPLESVKVEGSSIPEAIVMDIAELRLGLPIDKAGIEQACARIHETGLFGEISYRYAPGPKKGYALTLVLADQEPLIAASIDIPGVDANDTWKWLVSRFNRFDRKIPQPDSAQQYLAAQIEKHLGASLRGQHVTVRMETDFKTRETVLSFQPEVLPQIKSITFSGNQAATAEQLTAVMSKVTAGADFTERSFIARVEHNLRPFYEERGFYRVAFAVGSPEWADSGVALKVAIAEGETYRLGTVQVDGDELPLKAMLSAAKFPTGQLANWRKIQEGIWEMEKVVKRTGYFEAAAAPTRSYDDAARILSLQIRVAKGPLYHFGNLRITGLSPDLEERARRMWRPKPGDVYDYAYPYDFFQEFSRVIDFNKLRKYDARASQGAGDHVMDVTLVFEPR